MIIIIIMIIPTCHVTAEALPFESPHDLLIHRSVAGAGQDHIGIARDSSAWTLTLKGP